MVQIELTDEDAALICEILETELRELRDEIHHTDHRDYRKRLRAGRERVEQLVARLKPGTPSAAP